VIGTALILSPWSLLESASTVHCGMLAHLKNCKMCISILDSVAQEYI